MADLFEFPPAPKPPPRGEQFTIFKVSMQMFHTLQDIAGMADHGGWPVDPGPTYIALKRRGLVAEYSRYQGDLRACLSPLGIRAIDAFKRARNLS